MSTSASDLILITGATGTIGRALIAELKATGVNLVAGSRSGEAVDGVAGRVVDFQDPASLDAAFAGVERAFLLFPLVPNKREWAANALAAARRAGVRHVVRSSGAGADPHASESIGRLQGEIDQLVIESGIACTLLRPSSFMQNWINFYSGMVKAGTVYLPHAQGKTSFVDVRDIAAVAAVILRDPALHAGRAYTLTGPAALSVNDVLDHIANASGTRATYVPVAESAARESMQGMGMDEWTIDIMSSLNRLVAAGYTADLTGDVQRVTGHAPRSFAQFAADHASAWR